MHNLIAAALLVSLSCFAGETPSQPSSPAPLIDHCRGLMELFAVHARSLVLRHRSVTRKAEQLVNGETVLDLLRQKEFPDRFPKIGDAAKELFRVSIARRGLVLPWETEIADLRETSIEKVAYESLALLLAQKPRDFLMSPDNTTHPIDNFRAQNIPNSSLASLLLSPHAGQAEVRAALDGAGLMPERMVLAIARHVSAEEYPKELRSLAKLVDRPLDEKLSAPVDVLALDTRITQRFKLVEKLTTIHDLCANFKTLTWPAYSSSPREIEQKLKFLGLDPGKTYTEINPTPAANATYTRPITELDVDGEIRNKLIAARLDSVGALLRMPFEDLYRLLSPHEIAELYRALQQLEI